MDKVLNSRVLAENCLIIRNNSVVIPETGIKRMRLSVPLSIWSSQSVSDHRMLQINRCPTGNVGKSLSNEQLVYPNGAQSW